MAPGLTPKPRGGSLTVRSDVEIDEGEDITAIGAVKVGDIVEAAYADPQALEQPALTAPALCLARDNPGERIVILLDGIDELRLRDTSVDVLTWLTDHTQLPENVRFVVASRPDERLNALISNDRADVKRVILKEDGDARRFAELIADGQLVGAALASRDAPRDTFVSYATRRAGGNFRYLALLRGMIEENAADLDWLAEGADRWPAGLNALYRDYLLRTRDRVVHRQPMRGGGRGDLARRPH